jgi:hypothetical protein
MLYEMNVTSLNYLACPKKKKKIKASNLFIFMFTYHIFFFKKKKGEKEGIYAAKCLVVPSKLVEKLK